MKRFLSILIMLSMICGMNVSPAVYAEANNPKEYHFDISTIFSWDSKEQTKVSYSDGELTVTANSSNIYTQELKEDNCSFNDYRYFVLKLKNMPDNGNVDVMIRDSDWFKEDYRINHSIMKRYDDNGDIYLFYDMDAVRDKMVANGAWDGGYIKQIMLTSIPAGTYVFTDIYVSSVSPEPVLSDFSIIADSNTINTDEGSVTLTPNIEFSNGKEITDYSSVSWAVDSVNAEATINNDNTMTLTGKINGDITATAYYTYSGTEYSSTCTVTVSGQLDRVATKKVKLMTYGNSIHKHGPNSSLGWYGDWGMAASSEDKDYVHRLLAMLKEKYGETNVSWVIGSGQSNFESDVSNAQEGQDWSEYLKGLTTCAATEKPDIITIQYGENSHPGESGYSGTANGYRDAFIQFVQMLKKGAPDALVLITIPFWGGSVKEEGAKEAAEYLNIPIANLAQFNNYENKAYEGDEVDPNWANGVKEHPGNLGMENIAREMYKQLNKFLTGNDNVLYSIPVTGIKIVADTTEITEDSGKIVLSIKAQPDGASGDAIWSTSNAEVAEVDENGTVTAVGNGTAQITAVSKYNSELSDSITITISGQNPFYKLKFDSNTTDEVKDMPETMNVKAGAVSLTGKYPFRETYTFVGWSYEKDGAILNEAQITEDTTLYAVWKKADSWTFDRDDYKEGFTIENGFNQYVKDGVFKAIETEYSPINILKVYSPKLELNSDDYLELNIKIQNTAYNDDTVFHLTMHTTDGDFEFEYPVTTAQPTTYTINLDDVTGTITSFDFTPTNMDCTIYIDDIFFTALDPNDDRFILKRAEPNNGSVGFDPDADAILTFNRNIDISQAEVTLNGEKQTVLSIDETGKKLIIDFGTLEPVTSYILKVSGVKSIKGSVMTPCEMSFITKVHEKVLFDESFSKGDMSSIGAESITKTISSDSGTYNSAPNSMKVSYPMKDYSRIELDGIKLEVGKVYRISFYAMKPQGSTTKGINLVNPDEGFFVKTFGEPKNTMQYYEAEFKAEYKDSSKNTEGATIKPPFLRLPPSNDPNNVVYIDDIKLVELAENVRIENSEIDKNGHKNTAINKEIELEYAYKPRSVENVTLTTMQGEQLKGSTAIIKGNKIIITLDSNIKYNTYYTLTADAIDIYGKSFKVNTYFITEEQVKYDSVEILKNGTEVKYASQISAGDILTVKIKNLFNKSDNEAIDLSIIPTIYNADGTMAEVWNEYIHLAAGQTLPETTLEISAPESLQMAERLSVFIWSNISDNKIKSEISNYYSIN